MPRIWPGRVGGVATLTAAVVAVATAAAIGGTDPGADTGGVVAVPVAQAAPSDQPSSTPVAVVDRRIEPNYSHTVGVTQDAQGFVWFATSSGPIRFNGNTYDTYALGTDGEGGAVTNAIRDIVADPERGVWVATPALHHIDPWRPDAVAYPQRAERLVGAGDALWTWNQGVFALLRYSDGSLEVERTVEFPQETGIGDLALAADAEVLYIGDSSRASSIDTAGRISSFTVPAGVTGVTNRSAGGVWMVSPSGLWHFDGRQRPTLVASLPEVEPVRSSAVSRPTNGIVERADGSLWVGFASGNVYRFEPDSRTWTDATEVPQSRSTVSTIFEDRYGRLFVGRDDTIDRLGASRLVLDVLPLDLADEPGVRSQLTGIALDGDELFAMTRSGGLQQYEPATRSWQRRHDLDLPAAQGSRTGTDEVTGYVSTGRFKWLATWGGGLYRIDGMQDPESDVRIDALALVDASFISLAVAVDDAVWISTPGFGVQAISEAGRPLYSFDDRSEPPISNQRIEAIWPERGRVLLGGDAGLEIIDLDSGDVDRYSADQGTLTGRTVRSIFVDDRGAVWMATSAGLEVLEPGATTSLFRDGYNVALPSGVQALSGFAGGRFVFAVSDASLAVIGTADRQVRAVYDSTDGLPIGDSLTGWMVRGEDDSTYLASTSSIVRLSADALNNGLAYDVGLFVQCRVGCVALDDDEIDVRAGDLRFEFDVSGPVPRLGSRIEYQLVGAEDTPRITRVGEASVLYRDLPAGSYRLEARLLDAEGVEIASASTAGPGRTPVFTIEQAWWRSDRGRATIAAGLALLLIAAIVGNHLANRRRQRRLEATVSDRTMALNEARHAAEVALAAKSKLMSQVSHELRSPLTTVSGAAEMLNVTDLDDSQRLYLDLITSSGSHLASLIDDLVEVSVRDGNMYTIRLESVDVGQIVRSVVAGGTARAGPRAPILRSEVDPGVSGRYLLDGKRLRQVLSNLTSNSLQYANATEIVVAVRPEPDYPVTAESEMVEALRFEVRDDGGTFDDSDTERLLEPFERSEESHASGLGLGLSIATGIVQRLGGDLRVSVVPGESTTFWFVLELQHPDRPAPLSSTPAPSRAPLRDAAAPVASMDPVASVDPVDPVAPVASAVSSAPAGSAGPDAAAGPAGPAGPDAAAGPAGLDADDSDREVPESADVERRPRALVVDDDDMIRELISLMLAHLGWDAIQASTGTDAISVAEEFPVDAVFTDVMMVPMSGHELANRLREIVKVPIIATTGATLDSTAEFDAVLHKPVRLTDLAHAIEGTVAIV